MSEVEQLLEMGFTRSVAEEALNKTGNRGIDAAMDCCNKSMRNDDELQLHSARTGHVNFSESAEDIKPLTEEERKAQLEKLQDLIRLKKNERESHEVTDELDREKKRREQGKNIVSAKAKFQEDEIRRMAEERKREKEEDKAYRAKLVAQIAKEREEKKMRERAGAESQLVEPKPSPVIAPVQPVRTDYTKCRLSIRFPSGLPVKADFDAKDPLSAVILHISRQWPEVNGDPSSVVVFTTFPKREFSEEERQKSLADLGRSSSLCTIKCYLQDSSLKTEDILPLDTIRRRGRSISSFRVNADSLLSSEQRPYSRSHK